MPLPAASLWPRLATVARCSTQIRPMTMPRTIQAATAPSEGFVAGCAVFIDNDYHSRSGGVFRRRAVSLPSREGEDHFTPANPDIGQGPPWRHRPCREPQGLSQVKYRRRWLNGSPPRMGPGVRRDDAG